MCLENNEEYGVLYTSAFSHVLTVVSEVSLKLCVKELYLWNMHVSGPLSTEKEATVGYICLFPSLAGKLHSH